MANAGYRSIKLAADAHARLAALKDYVKKNGWASIGSKRQDLATTTNVLDEAITTLIARKESAKR